MKRKPRRAPPKKVECEYCHTKRDAHECVCPGCGRVYDYHAEEPPEPPTRPFSDEVAWAFIYPLTPSGLGVMIVAACCFAFLDLVPEEATTIWSKQWALITLGGTVLAYYLFDIVQNSAGGERRAPVLVDEFIDPDFGPHETFIMGLGGVLLCMCPLLVYEWFVAAHGWDPHYIIRVVLLAAGCVYLPVTLLSLAVWRDAEAVRPDIVVPAMRKLHVPTGISSGLLFVGGVLQTLPFWYWGPHLSAWAALEVNVAAMYLILVAGRVIGISHWIWRREIGWFEYDDTGTPEVNA